MEKHRLTALYKFDRAIENVEFVSLHVNLHECHILANDRIQPRDRHVGRDHRFRHGNSGLKRCETMNQSIVALRDE